MPLGYYICDYRRWHLPLQYSRKSIYSRCFLVVFHQNTERMEASKEPKYEDCHNGSQRGSPKQKNTGISELKSLKQHHLCLSAS
jgi:hypothetical protein